MVRGGCRIDRNSPAPGARASGIGNASTRCLHLATRVGGAGGARGGKFWVTIPRAVRAGGGDFLEARAARGVGERQPRRAAIGRRAKRSGRAGWAVAT